MYLFNNKGSLIEKTANNKIKKYGTIKFKEKHLKVLNKNDEGFYTIDLLDSLNFKPLKNGKANPKNSAKFIEIQSKISINIEQLKKELNSSIWEYDVIEDENSNPNKDLEIKQTIQFKKDSIHILTDYYYQGLKTVSEYETKGYSLFKVDNVCFLSLQKGNTNPQPIFQILNYDSKKINLKDFSSREIKSISFYKTNSFKLFLFEFFQCYHHKCQ
ncbi:hypothetical protein OOZ15_18530 [Galbibacter sp. EGI 63066]|uniref:hypothetical protein n=1 Tax=Galbibacter sp. EGI 63066 TaxID=2993559 RepID=UPI002248C969|nr:hypothetical protein [Galbibacter sp. EGI 63066]MCX2681954.1 hypothetical protein [Galbibacter sp. EGI 63066]